MRLSLILNADELIKRSELRRVLGKILLALVAAVLLGAFGGYLAGGDNSEAVRNQARMEERTEMVRTLYAAARTHNIYKIPGTEIIVEATVRPKGLKIVNIETVRQRAERVKDKHNGNKME